MYVCVCNSVTESDIRRVAEDDGVRTFSELKRLTGCSSTCGSCEDMARDVLDEAIQDQRVFLRVVSSQAA